MTVTIETILQEDDYAPVPGTTYEVARGITVTLKDPVYKLKREFLEALTERQGEDGIDLTLAKMVTEGAFPEQDDLFDQIVGRIIEDFTRACLPTLMRAGASSGASSPSNGTTLTSASPPGRERA